MEPPVRLNKFLAERLGVSRREADALISAGRVTVNGRVAKLGERIPLTMTDAVNSTSTGDGHGGDPAERKRSGEENARQDPSRGGTVIKCGGAIVPLNAKYVYVAFHKPIGYVCSRRAQGSAPTLYELLPKKYQHLKTVGRLDKDSSGLILLTNDGNFAFQMTHPKFRKTKVYEVELDRPLEPLHQQMISDYGVLLDDGPSQFKVITSTGDDPEEGRASEGGAAGGGYTWAGDDSGRGPQNVLRSKNFGEGEESAGPAQNKHRQDPSRVSDGAPTSYVVILAEGRNRQIRRTFAALGYHVTKLHRTHFGQYELGALRPGQFTEFTI